MSDIRLTILSFYNRTPKILKKVLGIVVNKLPKRFLYGKQFYTTMKNIYSLEYASKDQLNCFQLNKLKEVLRYAYEHTEYYRQLFQSISFDPYSFSNIEDIKNIPFLDKEIVRKYNKQLMNRNISSNKVKYVTTGGSTGEPLGFYLDKDISIKEWAFMTSQWSRIGYVPGDKRVIIRGYVTTEDTEKKYMYNFIRNELILSSFHMTEKNLKYYLDLINDFKPDFIHAYPSTIYILAKFIKNNSINKIPKLKGILAGSENTYSYQRKLVEEVFKCRYYSWYGHSEKILLGGECEYSSCYHMFPQYGYMELVDSKGNTIKEEGKVGEIVGTGFLNTVMPFIRYKTGDLGVFTNEKCKCGRNYLLIKKVEGRLHEFIVTKSNNFISFTALNMHSNIYDHVLQYQFYQAKPGEVILKIVKDQEYTDKDTKQIIGELNRKFDGQVDIKVCFVSNIQLTKRGKHKTIEQKIDIKY